MHIILLSGGSGSRLWPLSNHVRSKQFLKVLRGPSGEVESMVQRVYRQLLEERITDSITVATSMTQVDSIRRQLGTKVQIVVEPKRRNTFPAIALSVMHLISEQQANPEEVAVVMPVDVYAENSYFQLFRKMEAVVHGKKANMVLMGIRPTGPSEKYGYLVPKEKPEAFLRVENDWEASHEKVVTVDRFVEKPDHETAKKLLRDGALWNGGVFAFQLNWFLGELSRHTNARSFSELLAGYDTLHHNSFDYEIVEKISNLYAVEYEGIWQDLGTWDALSKRMVEPYTGKVSVGFCDNTHIINELDIPLIALGAKNMVVCATPDGILVADKAKSSSVKNYEGIIQRPMYEKRYWGEYKVLDYVQYSDEEKSLTKHLIIEDGKFISYQRHRFRREIWTVVNGSGEVMLEGEKRKIQKGDVVLVESGRKHAIRGTHSLHIIEVQIGNNLVEEDIERFEMEWE